MSSDLFLTICERLMRQPAVAYHEERVIGEVESLCREHGLDCFTDPVGNRVATVNTAPDLPPIALLAHMDHPGFEALRPLSERTWEARFLGGVGPQYFRPGLPLRCYPDGQTALLGEKLNASELLFKIEFPVAPVSPPQIAVWDLVPFSAESGRIKGRACDDLVGVACALATLIQLKQSGARANVRGLFTRAEEVGFHGTLLLAESGLVPRDALVVSLETSRELPPAQIGQGVILRVGDRASIFDNRGLRYLSQVATGLQEKDSAFRFQRALMSGGTCEATPFQEAGYRVVALCVALGNYHNCGSDHRILEEYVSLPDAQGMARLLLEIVTRFDEYDALTSKLNETLAGLAAEARKRLDGVCGGVELGRPGSSPIT
ncbi:MAG: M20/M25/M40 family metallo-hydrolase [Verrucomicrobia bacterium]|nr:M20/M25/M40 family metallo-hydrolase [Verrucomicrobiota bacterium]